MGGQVKVKPTGDDTVRSPNIAEPAASMTEASEFGRPICLSVCMIVRDNARTLDACLSSIRPWVDDMVIVDTGSTDNTPQIAAKYGARVFHFPWCDDFSAARNESIKHARGEWILWMDSDDTIDEANGRKLRSLAEGDHDETVLAYVMQVHCPGRVEDNGDVTVVDHVKLFRNRPDLRFEFRIHEQLLPSIRRAGGDVKWTDTFVVHSGADHTAEGRRRKHERDLRILDLELQDRPEHPFGLFNLGMTLADAGDHDAAIANLSRSIAVSTPNESHVAKAHALLIASLIELDRIDAAEVVCHKARDLFPDDPEVRFREGVLAHRLNFLHDAERAYLEVLDEGNRASDRFSSMDRGIVGFKARHNLALVYVDMGKLAEAQQQWQLALDDEPSFLPAWRGLADVLLQQNQFDAAEALGERMLEYLPLHGEGLFTKAKTAEAAGNLESAGQLYQAAVAAAPDNLTFFGGWCQLLFGHGSLIEAEAALLQLTQRQPDDPSAYHNLATVYVRMKHDRAAERAYRESLRLRPDSTPTLLQLAYVLQRLSRPEESEALLQQAARLSTDESVAEETGVNRSRDSIDCDENNSKHSTMVCPDDAFRVPQMATFADPAHRQTAIQNLKLAKQALNSLDVPFWLSCGTLLGCCREGDLIPHDQDIDLGVMIQFASPAIITALEKRGFRVEHCFGTSDCGLEFSFRREDVKLDLFFHYTKGDTNWMAVWRAKKMARYVFPRIATTRMVEFLGELFPIPDNARELLACQYGPDWQTPRTQWDYYTSPQNVQYE